MRRKIEHSLQVIEKAIKDYPNIAVASSFGKDSIVTLHLCLQVNPNIQVFSIMTPYKFQETFEYKTLITNLFNLNIETFSREEKEKELYKTDPHKCCNYYKVEPTREAIQKFNLDAWISGLRGTEGHTRKFLKEVEQKSGLYKINPILQWTEADVWLYHAINKIPVHPLYAEGYRSLGCEPCSKPYTDTERGGRWQGTNKAGGECGIHTQSMVLNSYFDLREEASIS